jgi:ElaB/YqjD/DUF883 family membrane-anchored ribosome-binding protein
MEVNMTMSTASKKTSPAKIKEALQLLEEAAKDKTLDIEKMIDKECEHLKKALVNVKEKMQEPLEHFKEKSVEIASHAAVQLDKSVHRNPWPYIGVTALVSLLLGCIFGKKG